MSELEYVEKNQNMPMTYRVVSIENSAPHWHHEYELFFILRGHVTVTTESGVKTPEAGEIVLFNPREIHSLTLPSKDNLCVVLQFSADIFREVYKLEFHFHMDDTPDALRRGLAKIGLLLFEKPDGYQFFARGVLYMLVGNMFKCLRYNMGESGKKVQTSLQEFDAVSRYIKEHFAEDISAERLCHDIGVSHAKLYRVIKAAGAVSYKNLANFYRVENAKVLLKNSATSVQAIATTSGFESDSSFFRVFKSFTGQSPTEYRKSPSVNTPQLDIRGYAAFRESDARALLKEWA